MPTVTVDRDELLRERRLADMREGQITRLFAENRLLRLTIAELRQKLGMREKATELQIERPAS